MLKYLRIAVTALSLIACVLLIALWVRSYYWNDVYAIYIGGKHIGLQSIVGRIFFARAPNINSFHLRIRDSERVGQLVRMDENLLGFNLYLDWHTTDFSLTSPHWFPVLLTAALASAPWLRRRFSLRTLLIATTLIAVGLGIIISTS